MEMKSLLITTGATVTFTKLIEQVLSPEFLNKVNDLGYKIVYLQYGNEPNKRSETLFQECVEKLTLAPIPDDKNEESVDFQYKQMKLVCFPYSNKLNSYIEKSNLVISHAGTGSLLDCLRLHKPLIVVINEDLMDNHQYEIANEFEKMGVCISCECNINKILAGCEKVEKGVRFNTLDTPKQKCLQNVIYSEV